MFLRITCCKKSLAASFSNSRRGRMLLEVSSRIPMRKRQIRVAPEISNFLRRAVFQNFEIALIQIRDEFVAAIDYRGDQVHQARGGNDRRGSRLCESRTLQDSVPDSVPARRWRWRAEAAVSGLAQFVARAWCGESQKQRCQEPCGSRRNRAQSSHANHHR